MRVQATAKRTRCLQAKKVAPVLCLPSATRQGYHITHQVVLRLYVGAEGRGDVRPVAGEVVFARYFYSVAYFLNDPAQDIPFENHFGMFVDGFD